jgi:multisubunit Na+/H+ antiporter MnhG subunit
MFIKEKLIGTFLSIVGIILNWRYDNKLIRLGNNTILEELGNIIACMGISITVYYYGKEAGYKKAREWFKEY